MASRSPTLQFTFWYAFAEQLPPDLSAPKAPWVRSRHHLVMHPAHHGPLVVWADIWLGGRCWIPQDMEALAELRGHKNTPHVTSSTRPSPAKIQWPYRRNEPWCNGELASWYMKLSKWVVEDMNISSNRYSYPLGSSEKNKRLEGSMHTAWEGTCACMLKTHHDQSAVEVYAIYKISPLNGQICFSGLEIEANNRTGKEAEERYLNQETSKHDVNSPCLGFRVLPICVGGYYTIRYKGSQWLANTASQNDRDRRMDIKCRCKRWCYWSHPRSDVRANIRSANAL